MHLNRHVRSLAAGLCALALACIARDAAAADQCTKVFTNWGNVCSEIAPLNAQILKLQGDLAKATSDADKNAINTQLADARTKLQAARAKSPQSSVCDALGPAPFPKPDCDHLATLLGEYVEGLDEKQIKGAPARPSAATDQQVQHEQVPENRTANNKSGTPAQQSAVESLQPIDLAGGAFSLAGTRAGTRGVATITVNPLALGDPRDALAGRLFDLSVTTPFALDASNSRNVRFLGLRARINAAAPISVKPLQDALSAYYAKSGKFADDLQKVLTNAPDIDKCAQSIMTTRAVTVEACGATVVGDAELAKFRADSVAAVAAARRQADRYYFGLDLRLDTGDPTGTLIVGDKGTRLQGALAGGLRVSQGERWDFELRGHAGGDYFRGLDAVNGAQPDPVFSVDWGGALVLQGTVKGSTDKQHIAFGAGVQGRNAKRSAAADAAPTNFVNLNLMVLVPATGGADTGLSVSVPLLDSKVTQGTIIAVSTDLGLLDGSSASASGG